MVPTEELEDTGTKSKLRWVTLGVIIAIAAAFLLRPAGEKPVPEFSLPLLGGGTLSSDDLEGDPVVLNFWASWCAPCREEAPLLEKTWQEYKDRGVKFVGVNIKDRAATARHFVEEYGITFPVVRDVDRELERGLQVYGLPETFFVDREWRLAATEAGERIAGRRGTVVLGPISQTELRRQIERMLDESS